MTRRKRIQFWGRDPDDDSLVREVLSGAKTATACLAEDYAVPVGDYDDGGYEVGDLVDVYDLRERWRCLIRVTAVYGFRFGSIPERLWREENCRSAAHFQEAHRRCWPEHDLTDDRQLMAMHFERVPDPEAP